MAFIEKQRKCMYSKACTSPDKIAGKHDCVKYLSKLVPMTQPIKFYDSH